MNVLAEWTNQQLITSIFEQNTVLISARVNESWFFLWLTFAGRPEKLWMKCIFSCCAPNTVAQGFFNNLGGCWKQSAFLHSIYFGLGSFSQTLAFEPLYFISDIKVLMRLVIRSVPKRYFLDILLFLFIALESSNSCHENVLRRCGGGNLYTRHFWYISVQTQIILKSFWNRFIAFHKASTNSKFKIILPNEE